MSLSGNLSEFSVLETLQVIALQQKTGTLTIESGRHKFGLHFRDGKLIGSQPESPTEPDALLDTLIGLGQLGRDEERRIRMLAADQGVDLWRQITNSWSLEPETLDETRNLVLQGILDKILLWNKGRFNFEAGPVPPISGPPWNVETAMLESMRRLDESADLKSSGFAETAVPTIVSEAPVDNGYEAENPVPETLARAIFSKINGKRSISEIVKQLGVAEYDVLTCLRDLSQRGMVLVEARTRSNSVTQILIEQPLRLRSPALAGFLLVLLVGAAASGFGIHHVTSAVIGAEFERSEELRETVRHQTAILQGVEIYRQRMGRYPERLTDLIQIEVWPTDQSRFLQDQDYIALDEGTRYRWEGRYSDETIQWAEVLRSSNTQAESMPADSFRP